MNQTTTRKIVMSDDDSNDDKIITDDTYVPEATKKDVTVRTRRRRRSKLEEFNGDIFRMVKNGNTIKEILFYLSDKIEVDGSTICRYYNKHKQD